MAAPPADAGVEGAADTTAAAAADSHSARVKGPGVPVPLPPRHITFSKLPLVVVSLCL